MKKAALKDKLFVTDNFGICLVYF